MAEKKEPARLRITQIRSGVGRPAKHRRTLEALGLTYQRTVVQGDTPAIRGMIDQVGHLVDVEEVKEGEA